MRPRIRSPILIRHELFWCHAFAVLSGPEDDTNPRVEMHEDFARLYEELAEAYRRRRKWRQANRAIAAAEHHLLASEPPELPPAVAAELPLTAARYERTNLRGKRR